VARITFWVVSAIIILASGLFFFHLSHEADENTYWIAGGVVTVAGCLLTDYVWRRCGKPAWRKSNS
jgi:uncharacterized membrane-anchored protein